MEDAFLGHIAEHPTDLVARRAFADWLMEQPDSARCERGEFIALQMDLAGKIRSPQRRAEMVRREAQLLARHESAWAAPVRGLVKGYAFRNGLGHALHVAVCGIIEDENFSHS